MMKIWLAREYLKDKYSSGFFGSQPNGTQLWCWVNLSLSVTHQILYLSEFSEVLN